MPQLLTNDTVTSAAKQWGGGVGTFEVTATAWNGATVALQKLQQDGSYIDVSSDTALLANGIVGFMLGPCTIRVQVRNAVPAGVNAAAWRTRS